MSEEKRCTGHCCKDFTFPFPPEQFARWGKMIKASKSCLKDNGKHCANMDTPANNLTTVTDMLIFKRMDRQNNSDGSSARNPIYHYTCKHFDGVNCTIYDRRPQLCRAYPNNGTCSYKACTSACSKKEQANQTLTEKWEEAKETCT